MQQINETTFIEVLLSGTKSLNEILTEIRSTTSKNTKQAILERERDAGNEQLKYLFEVCYSPKINFFTTVIPAYTNIREIYTATDAVQLLVETTASRKKTGQAASDYIAFVLSQTVKEDAPIVESVIKRDLECGVQTTTINKVWKNLILDLPYCGYSLFSKDKLKKLKGKLASECKADGLFTNIMVYDNCVEYMSRSSKPLKFSLPRYKEQSLSDACSVPYVLTAEALVKVLDEQGVWDGKSVLDRKTGNGMLNRNEVPKELIVFKVWDVISLEDFNNRKSTIPYHERRSGLISILKVSGLMGNTFIIPETVECKGMIDVLKHFVKMRKEGEEGTIVKTWDMPWSDTKTTKGLKLKAVFEAEYKITGYYPHEKKPNWLGGFNVETEDCLIKFNCGGGFSDEERQEFWTNRDKMLGGILTIAGNSIETSRTKDTYSIFLPRCIEYRIDKTKANTYDEVLEAAESTVNLLKELCIELGYSKEDIENI